MMRLILATAAGLFDTLLLQTIAVTGVAATQLGGCTFHNLLSPRADGSTDIEYHPERKRYLEEIQGIIIDEAMMAEYALGKTSLRCSAKFH